MYYTFLSGRYSKYKSEEQRMLPARPLEIASEKQAAHKS